MWIVGCKPKKTKNVFNLQWTANKIRMFFFQWHKSFLKIKKKLANFDTNISSGTSKSSAFPGASGHQLEGPRADLLSGRSHADDDAGAPSFMAGLQGCPLSPRNRGRIRKISTHPGLIFTRLICQDSKLWISLTGSEQVFQQKNTKVMVKY